MRSFLSGFFIGFTAGMLFSPKSGKETRADISGAYQEIRDRVVEEVSRVSDISRETYNQIVDSLTTAYTQTARITAEQASAIRRELEDGFERIKRTHQELQQRPARTTPAAS